MCAKELFLQDLYTHIPMYNQLLWLYLSLKDKWLVFTVEIPGISYTVAQYKTVVIHLI